MGLKEYFSQEACDRRAQERINKSFKSWADKLPGKIAKYRKKERMEQVMLIGYPRCDVKTLSSYRRLHEMCAAENIQIKNERYRYEGGNPHGEPAIVITLDKPYSSSPDANFHKKPVWVQPTLPGF